MIQGEGGVPPAGLLGPAPNGCLIQSGEGGFALSPHVVHVGDDITATVTDTTGHDSWSWGNIEAVLGEGSHKHHEHCADNTTSCTFPVGPDIASKDWQVYSQAITVPLLGSFAGAVSSDYFIVNDDDFQLGGTVFKGPHEPAPGVSLLASGDGGSERATTNAQGQYVFALHRGTYHVSVEGAAAAHSDPSFHRIALTRNVDGVDFQIDVKDHIDFKFTALPGATAAGNATISGSGTAVTSDTAVTSPDGQPVSAILQFTPPPETPKALICAPTGLVFPQLNSSGQPDAFNPFELGTAPLGHVLMRIYAGSEPGPWTMDAIEAARPEPGSASTSLDFAITPRNPSNIAQALYSLASAIKGSGQNRGMIHIFRIVVPQAAVSPGQVTAERTGDQELLLAFLQANFDALGPEDFGPVFTHATAIQAGRAAIEFAINGNTQILDSDTAAEIVNDAGNGTPLPASLQFLPSLSQYEAQFGTVFPGHLTPDPSDPLTYFGFPYPPLSDDGLVDAQFYSQCVRPDFLQMRVEVDSPVNLVFTNAAGQTFGATSPPGTGSGLELQGSKDAHTFILPAGTYTTALTGSGRGTAHVTVFTAGASAERAQAFTFPVRRGQTGNLALTATGATGELRFAGRSYRAAGGVTLTVRASRRHLRHGRPTTLVVHVSDPIGRAVPGAVVSAREGRRTLVSAFTNAGGAAPLRLSGVRRGRVKLSVSAPGALTATLAIQAS